MSGVARSGCFRRKVVWKLAAWCQRQGESSSQHGEHFLSWITRADRQRAERLSHDNTVSRLPNFLPLTSQGPSPVAGSQPGPVVSLSAAGVSVRTWTLTPAKLSSQAPCIFKCKEISGCKNLSYEALSFIFEVTEGWNKIKRDNYSPIE